AKKYSQQELQQDYTLLRDVLEKKHPSLYWYTSKDSMDHYFNTYYNNIADSMTELQFGWRILAPLTNKIHCGHTSFNMSKDWDAYAAKKSIPAFPLYLKVWKDTMLVIGHMSRKDSGIRNGAIVTAINGVSRKEIISRLLDYLPLDGYSNNANYLRISSNFPFYYRNIFGSYKHYQITYIDSTGIEKEMMLPMYVPAKPAIQIKKTTGRIKISKKQIKRIKRESERSLKIDSTINTAVLTLNTFSKGGGRHLRTFFRRSFKKIHKDSISNLILDLRNNGGGDIDMSVLLTKYLRNTPFKVADSTFAKAASLSPYTNHFKYGFFYNVGLFFLTRKHKDGEYHYGHFERHLYHPKKRNHFDGGLYILIAGPSFSASTLFCNSVKGQENVKLLGEETGGGWYGNNGIFIPDLVLPVTKLRVRVPLFRIVQFNHGEKNGSGILPDIYVPITTENVKKRIDRKMDAAKEIIKKSLTRSLQ
ncbi:MAG: hypothetical protein HY305_05975, partial [Sphingobacteriales bacterium]|nr:hypothetical protein [Sphingobacteriales bacterium]